MRSITILVLIYSLTKSLDVALTLKAPRLLALPGVGFSSKVQLGMFAVAEMSLIDDTYLS